MAADLNNFVANFLCVSLISVAHCGHYPDEEKLVLNLESLPENLIRKDASEYLLRVHGVSRKPKTLAKLACVGGGPKFRKDGRFPLYPVIELDAYARTKLGELVSSNAEAREAA
ncbi:MAG: hypothetical protein ACI9JL_000478 [Paracoccaceae bacterium]